MDKMKFFEKLKELYIGSVSEFVTKKGVKYT